MLFVIFQNIYWFRNRENITALRADAREKLNLQKRTHLFEEFKAGIWSKEDYVRQVAEIEGTNLQPVIESVSPTPKRQKRDYSPDWPEFDFDSGDSDAIIEL